MTKKESEFEKNYKIKTTRYTQTTVWTRGFCFTKRTNNGHNASIDTLGWTENCTSTSFLSVKCKKEKEQQQQMRRNEWNKCENKYTNELKEIGTKEERKLYKTIVWSQPFNLHLLSKNVVFALWKTSFSTHISTTTTTQIGRMYAFCLLHQKRRPFFVFLLSVGIVDCVCVCAASVYMCACLVLCTALWFAARFVLNLDDMNEMMNAIAHRLNVATATHIVIPKRTKWLAVISCTRGIFETKAIFHAIFVFASVSHLKISVYGSLLCQKPQRTMDRRLWLNWDQLYDAYFSIASRYSCLILNENSTAPPFQSARLLQHV